MCNIFTSYTAHLCTMKNSTTKTPTKATRSNAKNAPQKASYGIEKSKLAKLFEDCIKDLYWAEKELTKALPKMASKATSEKLVNAIEKHLEETQGHVQKLEQVFSILGKTARAKKCDAMEGLIKEAKGIMEETEEGAMRDAGIIAASQKVEHYEIASYGTVRTYAEILGMKDAVSILDSILAEEKNADSALSQVASSINLQASEEEEEG
jgi:ferritin-like metal-binding protein YciE